MMNAAENIEHAIGRLSVTTSAEADRRILDDAFVALEQATRGQVRGVKPTPWRLVLSSRMAKYAAIIVLGIAILSAVVLICSEVGQEEEPIAGPREERVPEPPAPRTELAKGLEQIEKMFGERDVDGLVAMLSDGEFESKVAAAKRLGQIGDSRAIEALSNLASQWQGDPQQNPFAQAIEQIESRQPAEQLQQERPQQQEPPGQSKSEFEPRGALCGFIADAETGEPVMDARVSIWISRIYRTEADANGFYCFDEVEQDGNYKIEVASKDYIGITDYRSLPVVRLEKGKQVVKNFELTKACQVEVRVINEAGKPVEGARIRVSSLADEMGREVGLGRHLKQTDEDGLILLGGFEPAETGYVITAMATHLGDPIKRGDHSYRRTIYDYAPGRLLVTLTDPDVIEYGEIVLKKGARVQGYAEYADGVPAAGLEISARPDWWHCTTVPEMVPIDANGIFTLTHIVPGAYSLNVHFPQSGGGSISYPVLQTQLPTADAVLAVKIPKRSPGSLVSISGEVTFAGNEEPDYVEVDAYSPEDRGHHSVSLHGGQRTFILDSLEPGTYTVSFSGPNVERTVVENVEAPCANLEVELKYVAKPRLQGSVVRAGTNEPVTEFSVRVRKIKVLRGIYYTQSSAWNDFDDPSGTFDIQAVGPGVYEVQVAADGFAWVWSDRINTDQNKPVRVELIPGGSITGRVVDEQGNPVGGAKVIPLSKACGTSRNLRDAFASEDGAVETGADGRFVLNNLPPGRESIKAKHHDYCFAVVADIEVVDGKATEQIEVVLAKGGGAEGYVYDEQGNRQAGVTLFFQDNSGYGGSGDQEAGRFGMAITDSNGFYRVDHLPEQVCYVNRGGTWSTLGVVRRAFLPQNGRVIRLDFGGKPVVTGQLIVKGRPLARGKVLLASVRSTYSGVFRCNARTDSEGLFWFAGMPAGRYGIYYEVPGKRNEWVKAAVIETGADDMDVGVIARQMGSVLISVVRGDAASRTEQPDVYLQEGSAIWATRVGQVSRPAADMQPYVVTDVPPGAYTAVARLSDGLLVRESVELKPDQHEAAVVVSLPGGTARVSGRLASGPQQAVILMSADEKIAMHVSATEDDSFLIENLPAGDYVIGRYFFGTVMPIAEFTLSEAETKLVDIDPADSVLLRTLSLQVYVFSDDGVPLTNAGVWLRGRPGDIEPLMQTDGTYLFVAEPGDYVLSAVSAGHQRASREISLLTGVTERIKPVLLRLKKQY